MRQCDTASLTELKSVRFFVVTTPRQRASNLQYNSGPLLQLPRLRSPTGAASVCKNTRVPAHFLMDWWKGETKPAGRGDDGNMVSFDPDADPDGFSHFLAHHGFVVLDLLTSAEVDVTLDSFWDDMRARGSDKLARDDPTTWETENWPLRGKFLTDSGAMTQVSDCVMFMHSFMELRS